MKTVEIELNSFQKDSIVAAIRDKKSILNLLVNSIRLLLMKDNLPLHTPEEVVGKLVLCVDKMSRIFVCVQNKITSFNFPFMVKMNDQDDMLFYHPSVGDIDSRVLSAVTQILNDPSFHSGCATAFADSIIDVEEEIEGIWELVRSLLTFEDGYLRYDCDADNVNGDLHPLNHIDVFYSSSSSFKLGLRHPIDVEALKDIVNIKTACTFLSRP
jgi:hypothetical protein